MNEETRTEVVAAWGEAAKVMVQLMWDAGIPKTDPRWKTLEAIQWATQVVKYDGQGDNE